MNFHSQRAKENTLGLDMTHDVPSFAQIHPFCEVEQQTRFPKIQENLEDIPGEVTPNDTHMHE
jgi:hypothetical protein